MNIRYLIASLSILLSIFAFSQGGSQQAGSQYFTQFTYDSSLTTQQIDQFKGNLDQNPNIYMARVDKITRGVFIITNNLQSFDENTVVSWISMNTPVIVCYRQGLFGIDQVIPFDSNFCSSAN
jgi:hypothetical protein